MNFKLQPPRPPSELVKWWISTEQQVHQIFREKLGHRDVFLQKLSFKVGFVSQPRPPSVNLILSTNIPSPNSYFPQVMPTGARNKKKQAKGSQLTSKNGVTPNTGPPIIPQNNFQELQALSEGEFYIIHTNKIK